MKKRLLSLTLALLCILSLALPARANTLLAAGEYAIVEGTSTLNLRQGPGTNYAWLGSAQQNDWVQILGESGNWYYVTIVESGRTGYMSKNFLTRASAFESSMGTNGVVTNPKATQFLNLRQYPSYSAPVLGIYYNGTAFSTLSFSDGWYQVLLRDGKVGYFRQEFVTVGNASPLGEAALVRTLNGGKLNLRTAPTYNGSSIIAQIANGRQVTVLLKGNLFWKVSVDGMVGYMDCSFLTEKGVSSVNPPAAQIPAARPETSGYVIVNNPKATQFLNLRQQPTTTSKVIAQYKNGVRFEVIEQGETWCKVYGSATGNIGYMMTKYLTLYGLPATPTKTVQNGSTYVNLRSAPSKESGTVFQRVYSGALVTVLTPGEEWTQVRYGNVVGYMMTYFLK
ncbi:MAG: hypothetical protein E7329_01685 [Clostridiales bacterium]|nr:hypothetical protein [Clostridiales bacterium]